MVGAWELTTWLRAAQPHSGQSRPTSQARWPYRLCMVPRQALCLPVPIIFGLSTVAYGLPILAGNNLQAACIREILRRFVRSRCAKETTVGSTPDPTQAKYGFRKTSGRIGWEERITAFSPVRSPASARAIQTR